MVAKSSADEKARLVFQVADLFFQGMKIRDIARELNLTREGVYPLLAKARELGLIRLVPPLEPELGQRVADKFKCNADSIRVVDVPGKEHGEQVAAVAAGVVVDLMKQVHRSGRDPVRLGLGPGRATRDFSKALGEYLVSDPSPPTLKLVAISAGCPATAPEYASSSFFNLFPRKVLERQPNGDHGCVGLFAEPLVSCKDFARIRSWTQFHEAFKECDEIDIVVTAMGDLDDEHDLLRMFQEKAGINVSQLKKKGWIGNVQYRPFSATGPILEKGDEMRAVTLFELDDFARLVEKKNKHVVLIARSCGICGKTRARALRPLLSVPRLKVWSEVVMDEATGRELLTRV